MGKISKILSSVAELFRAVTGTTKVKPFTSAVILAGGSSQRMGGTTTKQFAEIDGIPVIVRSMLAFEKSERINEIIIVAKADEAPLYTELAEKHCIKKLVKTVCGGSTRQESAMNGFNSISSKSKYVALHDGARCLITPEEIDTVLDAAIKYGGASAAQSVTDTVKIVDENGFSLRTEDRTRVMLAQTPQIFSVNLYAAAAYTAKEESFQATDDNMLAERIGYKVKMVECSKNNIKITFPEDIEKATEIIRKKAEKEINAK